MCGFYLHFYKYCTTIVSQFRSLKGLIHHQPHPSLIDCRCSNSAPSRGLDLPPRPHLSTTEIFDLQTPNTVSCFYASHESHVLETSPKSPKKSSAGDNLCYMEPVLQLHFYSSCRLIHRYYSSQYDISSEASPCNGNGSFSFRKSELPGDVFRHPQAC